MASFSDHTSSEGDNSVPSLSILPRIVPVRVRTTNRMCAQRVVVLTVSSAPEVIKVQGMSLTRRRRGALQFRLGGTCSLSCSLSPLHRRADTHLKQLSCKHVEALKGGETDRGEGLVLDAYCLCELLCGQSSVN